ncbi:MAG: D-alanyl-D-alanine carboxypeptidase [Clostridia bacterium]|nr:D-alanyl-D-alanine carboxypeptidase [Clostridia bacterium]
MKKSIIFFNALLIFLLIISFQPKSANANAIYKNNENLSNNLKITAKSALLLDYESGTVIYDKNASERLPIASMTKLASLSIILDAIDKGAIKENDLVRVSENAASVGGSSAFLDAGSEYKVCDLIKTIVIASANDSTVALSEYVSGTEEVFVSKMNQLSQKLELKDTNFENSTGLPSKNHYSSAYDMAKIYRTVCNHKLYKKYAKIWIDDFIHPSGRKTGLVNTNRLVKTFDGIEGGKTGYTDSAKFCLTASASRGSTRLIAVIIGAEDSKTRFAEISQMLSFGFSNYESKIIVNSEVPVTIIPIKNTKNSIEIYPEKNSKVFTQKSVDNNYTTDYKLNELKAPIKKGEIVGKMFVFDKNNMVIDEINLLSNSSIEKESFKDILNKLVNIW